MKKHITTVKERIDEAVDDGFSSIEEQIGTALISNHMANSDLRVARVLVHSLREEIRALEAQNENLRNELQRCEERLYQHGRETEEWVDRMKEMLRRIPGHGDA
ncbi:hypothetical protein BGW36DRAFT_384608 [Talaromyces proteolyticus]|uniref:Uncharacterized protein n=1 Tax=Talaromyces proteolyticus TaxID=1131652 RepID=A0AAD4PU68_9EURO|nr:uncharacterized protein BGW36DRAFT_384608 [Talaromyces proteolyticus]KAH8694253.1 hypothetical protein BGW36DRAFT_384608 [Talaromyces proteolyticus]